MSKIELLKGDCLDKLKGLQDNSIDSVVTDPPYEIGFMGKGWDDSGIANNPELWKEVLRVLKPGGHLLSFSHSRTYHRQAVAVEDAGFEIRDQIMWIYGSGFPKSHNIGKSVDKLQGNEREVVGKKEGTYANIKGKTLHGDPEVSNRDRIEVYNTKGNSEWEGWGTALKPAHEPIVMARKPLSEKTIVKNVLEWGTGGINIDESRVETTDKLRKLDGTFTFNAGQGADMKGKKNAFVEPGLGRFPANIIFDEEAGKILDEQSGVSKSLGGKGKISLDSSVNLGGGNNYFNYGDTGGASRFFYCPKASKKDRNEGCEELEEKKTSMFVDKNGVKGLGRATLPGNEHQPKEVQPTKNFHPTVKPTDLMAYLVRMVTPKGGTVLDPFMGSGSTGKASVREGFNFVGIEREDEYMEIAKTRIEHEQSKNKHRDFFDEK